MSAFTGEDLDARGVQDLYGLQEVSPSISVYSSNSTSNGGTIRIRGVGTTGNGCVSSCEASLEEAPGAYGEFVGCVANQAERPLDVAGLQRSVDLSDLETERAQSLDGWPRSLLNRFA